MYKLIPCGIQFHERVPYVKFRSLLVTKSSEHVDFLDKSQLASLYIAIGCYRGKTVVQIVFRELVDFQNVEGKVGPVWHRLEQPDSLRGEFIHSPEGPQLLRQTPVCHISPSASL